MKILAPTHRVNSSFNFMSTNQYQQSYKVQQLTSLKGVCQQKKCLQSNKYDNLVGCHSNCWVPNVYDKDQLIKAAKGTKEIGYDVIELNLLNSHLAPVDLIKSVLKEYDLKICGSMGLNDRQDISSEDENVVKGGKDLLISVIKVLAKIGGTTLGGPLYGPMRKNEAPLSSKGYSNVVKSLKEVSQVAESEGINLNLEILNRYETNVMNTGNMGLPVVREVGQPNLKLHFDTYHMNIEENSFRDAFNQCKDYIGYVHVGESHRGYLGTGTINFTDVFQGLHAAGYTGPITFETFSSAIIERELSNMLCIWRNTWTDSYDLARHAYNFMDTQLEAAYKKDTI